MNIKTLTTIPHCTLGISDRQKPFEFIYVDMLGGLLAERLRHWTLNHEIVGSSPSIRLVFSI